MKDLINKLLRMRKKMLKDGTCKKNTMLVQKAINKFQIYLEFFPNASDESLRNYCIVNYTYLMVLMPGRTSNAYETFHKSLIKYL